MRNGRLSLQASGFAQLIATIRRILNQSQPPVADAEASESAPVAAKPAAEPPIDMNSLQDRCLGDPAFAMEMLSLFAEQAPRQVAALGASVVGADAKLISPGSWPEGICGKSFRQSHECAGIEA